MSGAASAAASAAVGTWFDKCASGSGSGAAASSPSPSPSDASDPFSSLGWQPLVSAVCASPNLLGAERLFKSYASGCVDAWFVGMRRDRELAAERKRRRRRALLAAAGAVSVDGAASSAVEEIENEDDSSLPSWSSDIVRVVKVPEARELAAACAAAAASAATRAAFAAVGDFAAAVAAAPLSLLLGSGSSSSEKPETDVPAENNDGTPLRPSSSSSRYSSSPSSWRTDFGSWKRQAREAAVFAATDRRALRIWLVAAIVALSAAAFAAVALRFAARVACAVSPAACFPLLTGSAGVGGGFNGGAGKLLPWMS